MQEALHVQANPATRPSNVFFRPLNANKDHIALSIDCCQRKGLERKIKWYELPFIQRILVSSNRHSITIRRRGALAAIKRAAQLLVGVGVVQVGAWVGGGKLRVGRVDV